MARLFIALDLQLNLSGLGDLAALDGLRVLEHHHLTLAFLGEVGSGKTSQLVNALKRLKSPAFNIETTDIGVFPSPSKPRAIWVGAAPEAPFKALRQEVTAILDEVNMAYSPKFKPHLTFARAGRLKQKAVLQDILKRVDLSGQHFHIDRLYLKKSKLSHSGAQYSDVFSLPLS